jgi:adenylate cyclase
VQGPLFPAAQSDVMVVVIDEATYYSPPFTDKPQVAWTPYLAQVIDAVNAAEPAAIGLDLIYPVTLDQTDLLPGFDRPLLKSFLASGRSGRLVLGQARLSQQVIAPQRRQLVAAGGAANLRTLNLLLDADEVVRR